MAVTDVTPFVWDDDELAEAGAPSERIFGDLRRRPELRGPELRGPDGTLLGIWFDLGRPAE